MYFYDISQLAHWICWGFSEEYVAIKKFALILQNVFKTLQNVFKIYNWWSQHQKEIYQI